MMEKAIRGFMVGSVLAVIALVGAGWKAYGEINSMGKSIKAEVKQEMMEVRRSDMEYVQNRFNTLEKFMVGKVISEQKKFEDETQK